MTVRRLPLLQEPPLVRTSALGALNFSSLFILLPPSCISHSLTFTPASFPVLSMPGCTTWQMGSSTERLWRKRGGNQAVSCNSCILATAIISRVIIYFLSLAVTWVPKVVQTPILPSYFCQNICVRSAAFLFLKIEESCPYLMWIGTALPKAFKSWLQYICLILRQKCSTVV